MRRYFYAVLMVVCFSPLLAVPVLAADDTASAAAVAGDQLLLKSPADTQFLFSAIKSVFIGAILLSVVAGGLLLWRRKMAPVLGLQDDKFSPQLVASRRISQKTLLLVVRWQGRVYLLAENNGSLCLLDDASTEECSQ